ncbi:MAG: UDP-glucose 6-dehydrogenase [Flavobacteriales bacterium]|nr:UDP-glucose 6-dehydrogenase [Flavobacteriales bacterium]|tara:strand:+ start:54856 stop:56178 length:1323 start_codon:yes stop_codon:yes gene_type:complete
MRVAIVGSGYVGLVAAACLAEMGNNVICVDIDEIKIAKLKKGIIPIYEPGLSELVLENKKKGSLDFTININESLELAEIVFIAVGTPMGDDGSADLKYVLEVAKSIGENMQHHLIVVDKSTVPIGTADNVRDTIQGALNRRESDLTFDVVSNPEFLKEGSAINDFMHPDRVVVGTNNDKSMQIMKDLYAPFTVSSDRFIGMDIRSAEMTKYAANAMLATKISFINEIANICEHIGADVNQVRKGIGSDKRIGYKFIYPGCGYGGSCFPKDVQALINIAKGEGYSPDLLDAVEKVNNIQKEVLFSKLKENIGSSFKDKTIAIWGLAFKPNTDDMREAPSINLIRSIVKEGGRVNAYDPKAIHEARFYLKDIDINYYDNKYDVLENADALVLVTEWKEFRSPDFDIMRLKMKGNLFIDGRNQFKLGFIKSKGLRYIQIGVKA